MHVDVQLTRRYFNITLELYEHMTRGVSKMIDFNTTPADNLERPIHQHTANTKLLLDDHPSWQA